MPIIRVILFTTFTSSTSGSPSSISLLVSCVGGVNLPLGHPVWRGRGGERLLRLGYFQLFVVPRMTTVKYNARLGFTHLIGLARRTASRRSLWTSSSSSLFFLISSSLFVPSISASFCFILISKTLRSSALLSVWRLKLDTSLRGFSEGFGSKGALLRTWRCMCYV